ncbi:MAG: SUMF1/EgtB/PvdO family nonheme iron enzyme [Candidatus Omnitrophica bacterium]|nr:SUMF1/EgtB/PvdO family nonheme iron enzyme [Candidatus Omnitrophota bacterium]
MSLSTVKIVWNWGSDKLSEDGVTAISASTVARVKVLGIEMVYIPAGSFYVGDGTSSTITGQFESRTNGTAAQITSEDQLTLGGGGEGSIGNNNGSGMATADDFNDSTSKTLPADFPKGYSAFYMMKYEITEDEWIEFFNILTDAQKTTRDITSATGKNSDDVVNRNTVAWASGNATTARKDRACGYLSWMDFCAYADWAALRPMTELEYEKACRGSNAAVANEYAWGDASVTAAVTISGTEDGTETITTSDANCCYNNQTFSGGDGNSGPLRVGIFATSTSSRSRAGAGYYGNMELSGNLWEKAVTVGNTYGRVFTGTHGDGVLTATASYEGNATNTDWPGIDEIPSRGVTGAVGSCLKGGEYVNGTAYIRVSDRINGAAGSLTRFYHAGGRAVRTAS